MVRYIYAELVWTKNTGELANTEMCVSQVQFTSFTRLTISSEMKQQVNDLHNKFAAHFSVGAHLHCDFTHIISLHAVFTNRLDWHRFTYSWELYNGVGNTMIMKQNHGGISLNIVPFHYI